MRMLRSEAAVEEEFSLSSPSSKNKNKNKDKNTKRMLKARRAIEEYFEEKQLSSLTGNDYWEALS